MTSLVLAVALAFQQQAIRQTPTSAGDSAQAVTRQAITDVGRSVANSRNAHDLLRRAVFNSSDARVVERAQEMQQRCRELVTIARSATGKACRSCFAAGAQRAISGYRTTGLQAVARVGTRCVSQLTQDLRARNAAAAVRASIHALGQVLTSGLLPYEAKVLDVRRAFGLVVQPADVAQPRR